MHVRWECISVLKDWQQHLSITKITKNSPFSAHLRKSSCIFFLTDLCLHFQFEPTPWLKDKIANVYAAIPIAKRKSVQDITQLRMSLVSFCWGTFAGMKSRYYTDWHFHVQVTLIYIDAQASLYSSVCTRSSFCSRLPWEWRKKPSVKIQENL